MRHVSTTKGYTLVELLLVMAMVGMVAGAVLGVYQVSQDIYVRASSLEVAQVGARAGLDRMARELRLIGAGWVGASGAGDAITAASLSSITLMANVDDRSVINGAEATVTSPVTGTTVPLSISATATADAFKVYVNPSQNDYLSIADGGRREIRQITAINGNTLTITPISGPYPAGSVVRDVKIITYTRNAATNTLTRSQGGSGADPLVDNVLDLTFTYFDSTGGALGSTPNRALIREIQIALTVQGADGSQRRMTTRVKPRNLP